MIKINNNIYSQFKTNQIYVSSPAFISAKRRSCINRIDPKRISNKLFT